MINKLDFPFPVVQCSKLLVWLQTKLNSTQSHYHYLLLFITIFSLLIFFSSFRYLYLCCIICTQCGSQKLLHSYCQHNSGNSRSRGRAETCSWSAGTCYREVGWVAQWSNVGHGDQFWPAKHQFLCKNSKEYLRNNCCDAKYAKQKNKNKKGKRHLYVHVNI